jgi:hypothetical protein
LGRLTSTLSNTAAGGLRQSFKPCTKASNPAPKLQTLQTLHQTLKPLSNAKATHLVQVHVPQVCALGVVDQHALKDAAATLSTAQPELSQRSPVGHTHSTVRSSFGVTPQQLQMRLHAALLYAIVSHAIVSQQCAQQLPEWHACTQQYVLIVARDVQVPRTNRCSTDDKLGSQQCNNQTMVVQQLSQPCKGLAQPSQVS